MWNVLKLQFVYPFKASNTPKLFKNLLLTYLLTYLLTPWSRVLLEKLTGFAASQEIPRIFGTQGSSPYSQVPAT